MAEPGASQRTAQSKLRCARRARSERTGSQWCPPEARLEAARAGVHSSSAWCTWDRWAAAGPLTRQLPCCRGSA
eukprot:5106939-Lingulodinium_polyedra.AAC.1